MNIQTPQLQYVISATLAQINHTPTHRHHNCVITATLAPVSVTATVYRDLYIQKDRKIHLNDEKVPALSINYATHELFKKTSILKNIQITTTKYYIRLQSICMEMLGLKL